MNPTVGTDYVAAFKDLQKRRPVPWSDFTMVGETVKTPWPTNAYLSIPFSAQPRRPTETEVSDSGIELGQPCSA